MSFVYQDCQNLLGAEPATLRHLQNFQLEECRRLNEEKAAAGNRLFLRAKEKLSRQLDIDSYPVPGRLNLKSCTLKST